MSGIESGQNQEYNVKVSLNANDDIVGNLTNMSETNKESECEDSDCDLKNLVQELDEDEKIEGKINKNLADILNKV